MKKIRLLSVLAALAVSVSLALGGCSGGGSDTDGGSGTNSGSDSGSGGGAAESNPAMEFAKDMGIGMNLGNTMEAYEATNCEQITYTWIPTVGSNTPQDYETRWGAAVTTQETIDGMRDAGFSTVRIPVFWGNMMADDGTYTINEEYIGRVKEIVDYCMKDELYAVVNIHHFDEFIIRRNDLESCKEIFDNLWTQIAEYFKDYGDKLVFEGFNEYLGGEQFNEAGKLTEVPQNKAYELTNALNQTFVDAVRATGGNNAERMLVVSGYWTNIDLTSSDKFIMPNDSAEHRLMVSVHYIDNSMYWTNQIGGQSWLDYSRAQCELLKKRFTDNGIPVFVGETTSVYPRSNMAGDALYSTSSECLEVLLEMATDYGFVPVLWDTGGAYSRTSCKMTSDSDAEVIHKIAEKIANS